VAYTFLPFAWSILTILSEARKKIIKDGRSSDGFFERDASLLAALSTHPGVASEKALASSVQ
jgi:hypothetical protein